ncbi:(d)CMP kinase [Mariprofundus erugo]|uniref:Cytidylate kinase n=1 Tax=Mariprofundus erugo TaxID=2528639 RepID=A0A5R9GQI6_9PROT|nr:(d)CMP kinase [Mariprofundus erugo]TLS66527.1 (d)CMP kinase [Mariprofundus erugo]TLS77843.1 (d)CMP kinase [Mariprofundus erugo]
MAMWKPVAGLKIAVDGPSGSGKGTVAKLLAEEVGLPVLDTGLLYRLTGAVALQRGADLADEAAMVQVTVEMLDGLIWSSSGIEFHGEKWTDRLRGEEVGAAASMVAAMPEVRARLLTLQQQLAGSGCIMDGRDIGTVVLPDAPAKFFLTASVRERARRRWSQLKQMGRRCDFDEVLLDLKKRDQRDRERQHAPLAQAVDAIAIDSTTLRVDEVVDRMLGILERRGLIEAIDD